MPTSAQKGLPCHRQRGQQLVPGVCRPGSGKSPLQGCRTSEVSPKAHCTENQDLRREAAPTSPRSAISLCTSLFGAVWAFTLASVTERDFFKLSAFLSAWEKDNQSCKLWVRQPSASRLCLETVADTDGRLWNNTPPEHQNFLFLQEQVFAGSCPRKAHPPNTPGQRTSGSGADGELTSQEPFQPMRSSLLKARHTSGVSCSPHPQSNCPRTPCVSNWVQTPREVWLSARGTEATAKLWPTLLDTDILWQNLPIF